MIACYIDESGDTGALPTATSPIQPLLCVVGLTIDLARIRDFTLEFIDFKARFFPGLCSGMTRQARILEEIKGSEIRSAFRSSCTDHARRHHHIGFLDQLLRMLVKYDCKIFGRVWIKALVVEMDGWSTYTFSTQAICTTFNHLLTSKNDSGIVICDSRAHPQNVRVSYSVFTQKYKALGDPYQRIAEMPAFGHSENHAGLQVCDLISSALVFPIAAYSYCTGYVSNVHVDAGFKELKTRYGQRLNELQYRYIQVGSAKRHGGLTVNDCLGKKSGRYLFNDI
jgi:hypothetical protein